MARVKHPATERIFEIIYGLAGIAGEIVIDPKKFSSWNVDLYRHNRSYFKRVKQQRALWYLKRQKYIDYEYTDDQLIVRFAEAGIHKCYLMRLTSVDATMPEGVSCYVVFDIPERKRHARRMLTQLLKNAGFTRLQMSVWVTRKNVARELASFIRLHRVERYVRVIVGTDLTA